MGTVTSARAATIYVASGGNLQAALDAAQPGDTILLQEGAEFVGTFVLRLKPDGPAIIVRSSAPDSLLPRAGQRITPGHAPLLARLRSGTTAPALRTAPGASNWTIQYLEFSANTKGYGDLIQLGDGSSAQNTLASVPRHLVLQHLYVHGDPAVGQKRCIAINAGNVTIRDSFIAECKTVGQDSQAIGGWNGPGPYLIENNYIEGAGENVLFGGSDPAIANLVADGIIFRYNHVSRPMSWRAPIIPEAATVTAVAGTGGSLAAGTYGYRVVARRSVGQAITGRSTATVEVKTAVAAAGGTVTIRWEPVPLATEYRVYGRAPGAQTMYWTVAGSTFVDDGRAGTIENVPTTAGTTWLVKNLFELKNARNVVIEDNIFENHWKDAQPGYAIVLTPRNSDGSCTWCVIENVRFERNIVRDVAAGFNILGYDSPEATGQTRNVTLRHNLLYNIRKSLGGNGWFALIGDEPRDLTIDHNTIQFDGTTLMNVYGGSAMAPGAVLGLVMTNNATRHGSYGMNGSSFAYGNEILANYYPGATFTGNYLAGGSASRYPAGNFFTGVLDDQFIGSAAGDFSLRPDSILRGRGTDGLDIGADIAAISEGTAGVIEGRMPNTNMPPVASFTAACTDLTCTVTNTSSDAEGAITGWNWSFGDGGTSSEAEGTHTFASAGTYVLTLTVTDNDGLTSTESRAVTATAPKLPPVAAFTAACTDLTCTATDASTDADGSVSIWSWTFGDGASSSDLAPTHTFATAGTYVVTLTVTDNDGLTSTEARAVTVMAPNVPPTAALMTTCEGLACTFTDASVDVDGTIVERRWTFGDGSTGSAMSETHRFAAPGTYAVTLEVTDDRGSTANTTSSVTVGRFVHVAGLTGNITTWKTYWSTTVVFTLHDQNENPVAGAAVSFAWTGAVAKLASCVTNSAGQCTLSSGRLAAKKPAVTLTVTSISASESLYAPAANHDVPGSGASITLALPVVSPGQPTNGSAGSRTTTTVSGS